MQYHSDTNLEVTADVTQNPYRHLCFTVEVRKVESDVVTWVDITEDVTNIGGRVATSHPLTSILPSGMSRGTTCRASIRLRNKTVTDAGRRFSPFNTDDDSEWRYDPGGGYEWNVKPNWIGTAVRIKWGFKDSGTPEYVPLFYGYITNIRGSARDHTVTWELQDRSLLLRRRHVTTSLYQNVHPRAYIKNLMVYSNYYRDVDPTHAYDGSLQVKAGTITGSGNNYVDVTWTGPTPAADAYNKHIIYITDGAEGKGQVRRIYDMTTSRIYVYPNWTINPANSDEFKIIYGYNIDQGSYPLLYAWCDDYPVWDELCDVAQSQGGLVWFDGDGIFHFEDMHRLLTPQRTTSVITLHTHKLEDIVEEVRETEIINDVRVPYRVPRKGIRQPVWMAQESYQVFPDGVDNWQTAEAGITENAGYDDRANDIYANSVTVVDCKLSNPAYNFSNPVAETDYVAVAGGEDMTDSIEVVIHDASSQRIRLCLVNSTARYVYFTKLQIRGRPIVFGQEEEVKMTDDTSIDDQGHFSYTMPNTRYVQSREQAAAFCKFILDQHKNPRAVISVALPAIPYLEPGDLVSLVEDSTGITGDYAIHSIQWSVVNGERGVGSAKQTITLMETPSVLDDHATYQNYFILGQSKAGASGADVGRYGY